MIGRTALQDTGVEFVRVEMSERGKYIDCEGYYGYGMNRSKLVVIKTFVEVQS